MTKVRTFKIIKAYAGDGRRPEIDTYNEDDFMALPIHPFIKECAKNPDFDHFQISYFTHVTTISRGEDLTWGV